MKERAIFDRGRSLASERSWSPQDGWASVSSSRETSGWTSLRWLKAAEGCCGLRGGNLADGAV